VCQVNCRRCLRRATLEIYDRYDLKSVTLSATGPIRASVLARPRQNVAEFVDFLGRVEPVTAAVSVNFRETAVLVAIPQVGRADTQQLGNFGGTEAAQRFAFFRFEGNLHLPIKRLGKAVCKRSYVG